MKFRYILSVLVMCALISSVFMYITRSAFGSDHQDSPATLGRPGADITDVYVFPDKADADDVIVAMNVHPLIPAGQAERTYFDPGVMYQLKFDTRSLNGAPGSPIAENLVLQFKAGEPGPHQRITVFGGAPTLVGTTNTWVRKMGAGTYDEPFKAAGMTVYAGPREDPFFFDLAQVLKILPDRNGGKTDASCLPGLGDGTCPQGFNPKGTASDTLANFDVLSFVVKVPRAMLGGKKVALWATTSTRAAKENTYAQLDRLARPAVNEVFAAYARHDANNRDNPSDDAMQLKGDIASFMKNVAGRSDAISAVVQSVLVPDVLIFDASQRGAANYLGAETGGASSPTKSAFGGRALDDDIVDLSLGVIFGNVIPSLKLAPDDGKELDGTKGKPQLTTDNVGAERKHFLDRFPFLGDPR
ncbi:MAG: hypothetical protein NVS9B12_11210 [Vulcanimicrobiaceae bacterium]